MPTQIAVDKSTNSQFSDFNTPLQKARQDAGKPQAVVEAESERPVDNAKLFNTNKVDEENKPSAEEQEENIDQAIEVIAEFLNVSSRSVNFQRHEDSDRTIIKVFDNDTDELIRQFPSDEVLEIAQRIVELRQDVGKKTGILLDEKV